MRIYVLDGDPGLGQICIRATHAADAADDNGCVAAVIYMDLEQAEELCRDLRRKIDATPRLVCAADLGVVA